MASVAVFRRQIEASLARRIPSALTPAPRTIRPVATTGIPAVDALLEGGFPLGAVTELVGPECSGRTSLALSFLAGITQAARVCAWIDVSDALDPESAAAADVDLSRLLWVRCGARPASRTSSSQRPTFSLPEKHLSALAQKGLHGGGFGSHPRNEANGVSDAIGGLLRPESFAPRCAEPQRTVRPKKEAFVPNPQPVPAQQRRRLAPSSKPWARMDQALRVTDLLLQGGGFSAIVLDLGSIAPEYASRIPLATWFRYRAAAEQSQASILLLTQHPCAKSSAELLLRLQSGRVCGGESTVLTGIQHRVEVVRRRFAQDPGPVVSLRKPPQRATTADWQSRTPWAGPR